MNVKQNRYRQPAHVVHWLRKCTSALSFGFPGIDFALYIIVGGDIKTGVRGGLPLCVCAHGVRINPYAAVVYV